MTAAPDRARPRLALALGGGLAERLLELAREALPNEACAILSGPDALTATSLHPARNALASPYRFDLEPSDLVRIVHAVEASGEQLVAIFHSHPSSPALPSATDLREARYDVVHLIADLRAAAGVAGPVAMRGWRIEDGRAREVGLRLTTPGAGRRPSARG